KRLLCLLVGMLGASLGKPFVTAAEGSPESARLVTSVVQFRSLSAEEFLKGCAFELCGVVTLVDTNHHLIVLQDSTDAVALRIGAERHALAVGEMVRIAASN